MRRIAVLIVAALTLAGTARAQQTPQAPQKPQNMVARVVRASLAGIQLTDAEKTKLQAVREQYAPKFAVIAQAMPPIRARMKTAREAKDTAGFRAARKDMVAQRKQAVTLLASTLTDTRAVLTADQQARFDRNVVRVRRMIRNRFAP